VAVAQGEPSSLRLSGVTGTRAMTAANGVLWLIRKDGTMTRVDATTRDQRTVPLDAPASGVAVGARSLWLLDSESRTVRAVDEQTGATVRSVKVGGEPAGAVEAGGSLWVTVRAP
jgi:hypothetical protein